MEIYGVLMVAAGNQGAKEWVVLRSHRSGPFYLWIVMHIHHNLDLLISFSQTNH